MEDVAIWVSDLTKTFRLPNERTTSIKSAIVNFYHLSRGYQTQKALSSVSFEIKKGEFFGIVGKNGSGKSTLLKTLAGIYAPNKGSIKVNGKLTPFIELGVGFNPELSGRDNVYLNGALLGFSRREMDQMYKDIVGFAELEKFMDQKLKNYSSGMQVRLAFSIAIRANSDILLIDEVLAVGDAAFQQKCYDYFRELKKNGKTVVFVSHDRSAVQSFCDRALLIDRGRVVSIGDTSKVLGEYNDITLEQMTGEDPELRSPSRNRKKRWGTREVEITAASIEGKKFNKFQPNETINLRVDIKSHIHIIDPIFGIIIKRSDGSPVLTTNTKAEKIRTGELNAGTKLSVTYTINNIFGNGEYFISPAISNADGTAFYDWREELLKFFVTGWDDTYSNLHPPHKITIEKLK